MKNMLCTMLVYYINISLNIIYCKAIESVTHLYCLLADPVDIYNLLVDISRSGGAIEKKFSTTAFKFTKRFLLLLCELCWHGRAIHLPSADNLLLTLPLRKKLTI